ALSRYARERLAVHRWFDLAPRRGSVDRIVDLDGVAELALQVLPQAPLEALLDLADALARDAEALRDLDQRRGLVVEQPVPEDLQVAVTQRLAERVQLLLQDRAELAGLDLNVRAQRRRRAHEIALRAVALLVGAHRRVQRRLGRVEPALHLDDLLFGDVERRGQVLGLDLVALLLQLLAFLAEVEEQLALRLRGPDLD